MKNFWRRLHSTGGQDDPSDSAHPKVPKTRFSFSDAVAPSSTSDSKPLTGLSGLLSAAKHSLSQSGSAKHKRESSVSTDTEEKEQRDEGGPVDGQQCELETSIITGGTCESDQRPGGLGGKIKEHSAVSNTDWASAAAAKEMEQKGAAERRGLWHSVDAILNEPPGLLRAQTAETAALQLASNQALLLQDEELQVRVAMALSARDDPEAASIETMKDVSLGSDPSLSNSAAQLLAYRYWKYNYLSYEDKILDGFYDVSGVVSDNSVNALPSLADLQENSVSDQEFGEAVVVNRAADTDLFEVEQQAVLLVDLASSSELVAAGDWKGNDLVSRIAEMVAERFGGHVQNEEDLVKDWKESSRLLKQSLKSVVLPLGCLQVGLGRHRALLFKVLADAVGIPCQLMKGKQYTGDDEAAVNIIKSEARGEFIVDLMAVPGSLIPYDPASIAVFKSDTGVMKGDRVLSLQTSSKTGMDSTAGKRVSFGGIEDTTASQISQDKLQHSEPGNLEEVRAVPARRLGNRPAILRRSPSWTEGIGFPSAKDPKAKDASQYMMNAAKENPTLAQKLHDVLLESGVQAPPELLNEMSANQLQAQINEDRKVVEENLRATFVKGDAVRRKEKSSVGPGRPASALISHNSGSEESGKDRLQRLNSVEGLGDRRPLDLSGLNVSPNSSPNSSSGAAAQSSMPALPAAAALSLVQDTLPTDMMKNSTVAAAAATAAVVASSMMVAAAKSDFVSESTLDVPVAAAATATAAVVAATRAVTVTSAAAGRRLELQEEISRRHEEADAISRNSENSPSEGLGFGGADKLKEEERVSDKSSGSYSTMSDRALEDVAEWEIFWDELNIGERIGLGSYGEVYRGDWHGTEIAVKKFLDQDISGDALMEFGTEVRLMKRMRHPNVVLFMGAVMKAPNLSIVTEFLPRGSLYRLIHRSNNQLDERRRMRMALDVARGMNYLHSCTPVIVHRDLKSPNLLVDRNWVVKVCDFGLSRIKHSTYLSSKSTAGTPEWMAPEVLRNEPSNEKSDVYSFGVILWELATLQQPWAGMNPMQVVGAVGFQCRNLDIPTDLDPIVVNLIRWCWQSNPASRPSFEDIMSTLKPLQKPITQSQTSRE